MIRWRTNRRSFRSQAGITLVELLIGGTIGGMLLAGSTYVIIRVLKGSTKIISGGDAKEMWTKVNKAANDPRAIEQSAADPSNPMLAACLSPNPDNAYPPVLDCTAGNQLVPFNLFQNGQQVAGTDVAPVVVGPRELRAYFRPTCETTNGAPNTSCSQAMSIAIEVRMTETRDEYGKLLSAPRTLASTDAHSMRTDVITRGQMSWRGCPTNMMMDGTDGRGDPRCVPMPPRACSDGNHPMSFINFGLSGGIGGNADCTPVDYQGSCGAEEYASYVNGARTCSSVREQIRPKVATRVTEYLNSIAGNCPAGTVLKGIETDGTKRCRRVIYLAGRRVLSPPLNTNVPMVSIIPVGNATVVAATCGLRNNLWSNPAQYGLCNCFAGNGGNHIALSTMWYQEFPNAVAPGLSCVISYMAVAVEN